MNSYTQDSIVALATGYTHEERFESSFVDPKRDVSRGKQWKSPNGYWSYNPPCFGEDLNEIHKAEKTLTPEQFEAYCITLVRVYYKNFDLTMNKTHDDVSARVLRRVNASQCREALVRTFGKWEDSE